MRKLLNSLFNRSPESGKKRFQDLYGNIPIGVCRLNHDLQWMAANQKMVTMLGFTNEADVLNQTRRFDQFFFDSAHQQKFRDLLERQKQVPDFYTGLTTQDGREIQVTISAKFHRNPTKRIQFYELYIRETNQQDKRKDSSAILARISKMVQATKDLSQLYKKIHGILDEALDTPNFYIAIIDEVDDALFFPYYVDELDDIWEIHNISNPETNCLSLDVIRNQKPLFITRAMIEEKDVDVIGPVPEIWIGIPLKVKNAVIGLMAIQHYTDPNHFTRDDMDILMLISEQIAMAIERRMYANIPESSMPENRLIKTHTQNG